VAEKLTARSTDGPRQGLPPGPPLPRLVQTALWGARPLQFYRACERRYGRIYTLRTLIIGDVVTISDPAVIKEVFTGDRDVLHAGEANAVMGPLVGSHSLLLLDGERHLRHRKLLTAPLHGDAVRAYRERVRRIATKDIERWPVGRPFAIRERMQAITLEVILRAVIGVSDPARLGRLRTLLAQLTEIGPAEMWLAWAYPQLLSNRLVRRHSSLRALPEVDRLIYEEIAAHRADPDGREDILALLVGARDEQGMALSDEELRDEIVTLLLAGHETTTTGLAWCFERLLRHPRVLERLLGELEGEEESYLDAVVNETLRVRPVIDAVWRRLKAPVEVGGWLLPADTTVMPSIVLVQESSSAFGDALSFRPERFLEGASAPYTLIPFGGGPRRCIGAAFATMEMKTILRAVLGRVRLRAPTLADEPVRVHHISFVPAHGAQVLVTERAPQAPIDEQDPGAAIEPALSGPST
jgi:cytochrome P450 family 135